MKIKKIKKYKSRYVIQLGVCWNLPNYSVLSCFPISRIMQWIKASSHYKLIFTGSIGQMVGFCLLTNHSILVYLWNGDEIWLKPKPKAGDHFGWQIFQAFFTDFFPLLSIHLQTQYDRSCLPCYSSNRVLNHPRYLLTFTQHFKITWPFKISMHQILTVS